MGTILSKGCKSSLANRLRGIMTTAPVIPNRLSKQFNNTESGLFSSATNGSPAGFGREAESSPPILGVMDPQRVTATHKPAVLPILMGHSTSTNPHQRNAQNNGCCMVFGYETLATFAPPLLGLGLADGCVLPVGAFGMGRLGTADESIALAPDVSAADGWTLPVGDNDPLPNKVPGWSSGVSSVGADGATDGRTLGMSLECGIGGAKMIISGAGKGVASVCKDVLERTVTVTRIPASQCAPTSQTNSRSEPASASTNTHVAGDCDPTSMLPDSSHVPVG